MRTQTSNKILEILTAQGKVKPGVLATVLGISPQALHRQLRKLEDQGLIVARGRPPMTRYMLSDRPDFEDAFRWLGSREPPRLAPTWVSETREVLAARLPRLKSVVAEGLSPGDLPLLIAICGEIGNNSFDHNLGSWRDVPGCWMEWQPLGARLWICIGDRGQGVRRSLARVVPQLTDDQAALDVAFAQFLSGRAPEKRGNGLKFVRENIIKTPGAGLSCLSGKGLVSFGDKGENCAAALRAHFSQMDGTVTLMAWRLG